MFLKYFLVSPLIETQYLKNFSPIYKHSTDLRKQELLSDFNIDLYS